MPVASDSAVRQLDGADLEAALTNTRWAMVEFWADWCLFSRLLKPKMEWLAQRYPGRLTVIRCRVDGAEPVLARWRIRYLPALLLVHTGRPVHCWYGDTPVNEFCRAIQAVTEHEHDCTD